MNYDFLAENRKKAEEIKRQERLNASAKAGR